MTEATAYANPVGRPYDAKMESENLQPPATPAPPPPVGLRQAQAIGAGSLTQSEPQTSKPKTTAPLTPSTVTEALEDILSRQNEIKKALDVVIADATTLRLQM